MDPRVNAIAQPAAEFSDVDWDALPLGVEQLEDSAGNLYFVNHMDRSTSWFSPREEREANELRALEEAASQAQLELTRHQGRIDAFRAEAKVRKARQREIVDKSGAARQTLLFPRS